MRRPAARRRRRIKIFADANHRRVGKIAGNDGIGISLRLGLKSKEN